MEFFWSVFSRIRTEYGEINGAGLDKLENEIGFTVDTHEDENINMKPTVMKFCTNTRFDRAHLKIRTELQKT